AKGASYKNLTFDSDSTVGKYAGNIMGLTHKIRNSFRTSGAGQLASNGKTSFLIGLLVPISWWTTEKSVIKGRCHLLRQKNLPF
ncbi:hypothetical protein, partial [Coprococcus comes]|uniref:hypothetical protein n=1 Tax=Coprococcus comes TaxID=410072 RepID=UPI001A9BA1BA